MHEFMNAFLSLCSIYLVIGFDVAVLDQGQPGLLSPTSLSISSDHEGSTHVKFQEPNFKTLKIFIWLLNYF